MKMDNLDIVRMIKRKYGEVENHIDSQIISNNHYYHKNIHKEEYIHTVCHNMSYWFISNLGLHTYDDFFKLVETCKPIMIRLFRTKLSIAHEILTQSQDNNKKIIYSTSVENPSVFNTTTNTDINISELLGYQP